MTRWCLRNLVMSESDAISDVPTNPSRCGPFFNVWCCYSLLGQWRQKYKVTVVTLRDHYLYGWPIEMPDLLNGCHNIKKTHYCF